MKLTSLVSTVALALFLTACKSEKKAAPTSPSSDQKTEVSEQKSQKDRQITAESVKSLITLGAFKQVKTTFNGKDQELELCDTDDIYRFDATGKLSIELNLECSENDEDEAVNNNNALNINYEVKEEDKEKEDGTKVKLVAIVINGDDSDQELFVTKMNDTAIETTSISEVENDKGELEKEEVVITWELVNE